MRGGKKGPGDHNRRSAGCSNAIENDKTGYCSRFPLDLTTPGLEASMSPEELNFLGAEDPTVRMMLDDGIPVTKDNWLYLAFVLGNLEPELEAEMLRLLEQDADGDSV